LLMHPYNKYCEWGPNSKTRPHLKKIRLTNI
jgi:hypothetical protein